MKVGGIVLCGGRSSRMGRPKAWLPFGDELMLPRIVRIVREVVETVVVVAAPGQDVPPLPCDVEIVRDEVEGNGPLAGFAAGLAALADRADAVFLCSCDVPLLEPEFAARILSSLDHHSAAVPRIDNVPHPLLAAYRTTVWPHVLRLLELQRFRMRNLLEVVPTRYLEVHELPNRDSLRNVNSPDDYAAVLEMLKGWGSGL